MRHTIALTVALLLSSPWIAAAQPARPSAETARDQARRLADEGQRLLDEGDYRGAIERLREADTRFAAPTIKQAMAEAHEKLGELIEAQALYQRIAAEDLGDAAPEEFREARAQAAAAVTRLEQAIPRMVFALTGPRPAGIALKLDGADLPSSAWGGPVKVNPGKHTLVIEATGRPAETRTLKLKEGQTRRVPIGGADVPGETADEAEAPPPAAPRRSIAAPAVAFSLSATALIAGAITGGAAIAEMQSFRRRCGPDLQCPPSLQGELDGARAAGHASTVSFAVAGVSAAMGAALLLWPVQDRRPGVSVSAGPLGVTVKGWF